MVWIAASRVHQHSRHSWLVLRQVLSCVGIRSRGLEADAFGGQCPSNKAATVLACECTVRLQHAVLGPVATDQDRVS